MKKEGVVFCFTEVIAENEALLGCLLELLIVTLMALHMSIQGAKKWGILDQSTSNCYKRIAEIGKMLINRKISLEDFLHNLHAVTTISDGTLVRRTGKKVYAAKKLKNYAKGNYGVYQDMLRNAKGLPQNKFQFYVFCDLIVSFQFGCFLCRSKYNFDISSSENVLPFS